MRMYTVHLLFMCAYECVCTCSFCLQGTLPGILIGLYHLDNSELTLKALNCKTGYIQFGSVFPSKLLGQVELGSTFSSMLLGAWNQTSLFQ